MPGKGLYAGPMIESLRDSFLHEASAASNLADLSLVRARYLGRKGAVTAALRGLSGLPPEERRMQGKAVNDIKEFIEVELSRRELQLRSEEHQRRLLAESLDVTLPGKAVPFGRPHPLNQTLDEIIGIFVRMGFSVEEGPEVELDYYNFEALNIPKDHPARDMQDTFYVSDDVVLRTHTSPVQIRGMKKRRPPVRFIAPGKVYRCDADVSHTPMFHQIEGLMVDRDVSFSELKGVLASFVHQMFGPEIPVRFRPSFFPFTEPSAEADIGCILCRGEGCRVCKESGWLEVLGAGMVNPVVLENVGYDPEEHTGFAFGMGVERIAMLRYAIDDIRLFFENDLRFLRQF